MSKSENEILQDAQRARKVIDAVYSLLDVIDQKTGFEQAAADAEARYKAADEKYVGLEQELLALQTQVNQTAKDAESAREYVKKIKADADAKAQDTRLLAQNEAGLTIQKALDESAKVAKESAANLAAVENTIAARQKYLDNIETTITAKTTELATVQGDLAAAKEEIRRKFLNN